MIQNKRLALITKMLDAEGAVDVKILSERLKVTEKTIRLDLDILENEGLLERVHGGAVSKGRRLPISFPDTDRRGKNSEQKKMIAQGALSLIKENDVILLDDGSTTLELARILGDFKVTVLTNDMLILNELMCKENVTLYIIGGRVRRDSDSYIVTGEDAIQFLQKYRVGKLFLGTSTIDLKEGLMIYNYGDNSTKRAFINAADTVICLADSTKFEQTAFTRVASIQELDIIITDSGISGDVAEKYRELELQVITV